MDKNGTRKKNRGKERKPVVISETGKKSRSYRREGSDKKKRF